MACIRKGLHPAFENTCGSRRMVFTDMPWLMHWYKLYVKRQGIDAGSWKEDRIGEEKETKMTNLEKYRHAFVEGLESGAEGLEELVFEGIPEWDSVGHMGLVACIEEAFDIMLETEDMIAFHSYEEGIKILNKYGIVL